MGSLAQVLVKMQGAVSFLVVDRGKIEVQHAKFRLHRIDANVPFAPAVVAVLVENRAAAIEANLRLIEAKQLQRCNDSMPHFFRRRGIVYWEETANAEQTLTTRGGRAR